MIRQKIVLGSYIFIVDLYKANEDLINPTYKKFNILKNSDFISGTICDNHIYLIDKDIDVKNIIYPINNTTSVGYSIDSTTFDSNINVEDDKCFYSLYDENFEEKEILCDMIRIYFPTIKNSINAIIDVENFINDIKFHYLITDINDHKRYSKNEFTINHQTYSEYINIYIPSLNELLYNDKIFINEYNNCVKYNGSEEYTLNKSNGSLSIVPFNTLYYPFEIITEREGNNKPIYKKKIITSSNYINNQFYSTLNLIMYPYTEVDSFGSFIIDTNLNANSTSFNMRIEVTLKTEIRFPLKTDFNDNLINYVRYYGVPCSISTFSIEHISGDSIIDKYLKLNGLTLEDYEEYDPYNKEMINYKDADDDIFGEELWEITKTGFYIEMATDKKFTNIFFKYKVNIDDINSLIDNFTFPLIGIFSSWDDVPNIIIYRITFIDKVACNKIQSNPVIITNEWYKYLVNNELKPKLHLNKVYKSIKINDEQKMLVGNYNDNENPILFIDKINCSIVKNQTDTENNIEVIKKNEPKIIYKPVFYRTTELQNINIKSGVVQNIGINLDEYMAKVETFKLIIGNNEYIEYGRNNVFVIFKINATKLNDESGKYIITNEENEYISDGTYIIN